MNVKYIYVVSILVIAMIGIGCVDKISENKILTDGKAKIDTLVNKITHGNISSSELVNTLNNASSSEAINTLGNISSPEATNVSDNTSSDGTTGVQTEDKSVIKTFNIGEEQNMLGVNVKLVNITDYDNNTATLLINNVEYKYDPASDIKIQANGVEVIDLISSEDDKTAEITVDYIAR